MVDDLASGEIYINRTLGESIHAHHAGFKESGIGGEDGKWGLLRAALEHRGPAPSPFQTSSPVRRRPDR